MTETKLQKFAECAAAARSACEARAAGRVASFGPPVDGTEICVPALAEASGALDDLNGGKAAFENPVEFASAVVDLMKAYACERRPEMVEKLFHRLPRFPRADDLDDRLSEGARIFSSAALDVGDLVTAEQACCDGFPDGHCFKTAAKRLEAAVLLIAKHLTLGDFRKALQFFRPFVPDMSNPSWAPKPTLGESWEEAEARKGFERRLSEAAAALFDHCERFQLFAEMSDLYDMVEKLGGADELAELRLAKSAALVRLAVETGRLSDGVHYYGSLSCLSYLDSSGETLSKTLMILIDAFRDTGDEYAVQKLITGG
ncbi:MAG: hypothetical protein LBQ12_14290 [Deltaproteobacteria bacterium]|jgi:hypothetical protein|nr:hypothetical protein [Deltaproteobacteria bacterium]